MVINIKSFLCIFTNAKLNILSSILSAVLPWVEGVGGHTVDEPVQGGQGVDQPPAHNKPVSCAFR